MIHIDGSQGEGGGQVLRTALSLSLVTGQPFRIDGIRAGRRKPGLLRQHLTAVRAATEVGQAETRGAEIGSRQLEFQPGALRGGEFRYAVGTAGSACLVLQTVLPALLHAPSASRVTIEGGTHNPFAPPFPFLERSFAPQLRRMGAELELRLERPGFYPAGGGTLHADIQPTIDWKPFELLERGPKVAKRLTIHHAHLARRIAESEIEAVRKRLSYADDEIQIIDHPNSAGPGNVLFLESEHEHVTEVITSFGQVGVSAKQVADRACRAMFAWIRSDAPVGSHLADQLLLPLALGAGGSFRTLAPTQHTSTNADVIRSFLPNLDLRLEAGTDGTHLVKASTPTHLVGRWQ